MLAPAGVANMQVVCRGVLFLPYWFGHGSVFVYDGTADHWAEIDCRVGEVTKKWRRTSKRPDQASVYFNESHPRDGVFTCPGKYWGSHEVKV